MKRRCITRMLGIGCLIATVFGQCVLLFYSGVPHSWNLPISDADEIAVVDDYLVIACGSMSRIQVYNNKGDFVKWFGVHSCYRRLSVRGDEHGRIIVTAPSGRPWRYVYDLKGRCLEEMELPRDFDMAAKPITAVENGKFTYCLVGSLWPYVEARSSTGSSTKVVIKSPLYLCPTVFPFPGMVIALLGMIYLAWEFQLHQNRRKVSPGAAAGFPVTRLD